MRRKLSRRALQRPPQKLAVAKAPASAAQPVATESSFRSESSSSEGFGREAGSCDAKAEPKQNRPRRSCSEAAAASAPVTVPAE